MKIKELKENLEDREWRLNNLYWIKNDEGERVKFKFNWTQKILFDNIWYFNVILKSRQLGITTFFCILYLDDVIFNGYDAGLIAHTREDAIKIFDTKVKYAWDNLPEMIRQEYKLNTDNTRELSFKRGSQESSIYVGTTLRSGTVQRLHWSEAGIIDSKYPQRAKDILEGALNTVHKGGIITVESTAKGNEGVFFDICKQARDFARTGEELSEMDWKFFFFPWFKHPAYKLKGNFIIPVKEQEYFKKIEVEEKAKLSQEQKNWYFKKKLIQKGGMKSEFPSNPDEAFEASIEGVYYERELNKLLEDNRIRIVPYEPKLPVDTYWDLGTAKTRKDATSIVFVQDIGMEIHIIDFYGNTGEGLAHYINMLQSRGYIYGRHYAPHDIQVRELGTGKTRLETAVSLGLHFDIVDNIGFEDGIEATRMIFNKCWFDGEKTAELIKALQNYRKEWNEKLGRYSDRPLKNWACDLCFLPGTKILTNRGERNIEDIKVGDKVITPFGIRKVLNAGKSGHFKFYSVLKYGNKKVKITNNHKVFVNGKFKLVKDIKIGDKLESYNIFNLLKWRIKKVLFLKEENIGFREVIIRGGDGKMGNLHRYIERFGLNISEKFQRIVVSITRMKTKQTMQLRTLNVLMQGNIAYSIQNKELKNDQMHLKGLFLREEKRQRNGISQRKEGNGIVNTEKKFGKIENPLRKNVLNVVRCIKHFIKNVQSFVVIIVKIGIDTIGLNPKVREKYSVCKDVDVYNLTVEKDNVYYANGILVSNCDAFRMLAVGHRDHLRLGNLDPEEEEMRRIREEEESSSNVLNPFEM